MRRASALAALALLLVIAGPAVAQQTIRCGSLGCTDGRTGSSLTPFSNLLTSTFARPAADQCTCWRGTLTASMATIGHALVNVSGADADDIVQIAAFDRTGQTKIVQATITVTGTGNQNLVNTVTAPVIPRDDYWFCVSNGQVSGASAWNLASGGTGLWVKTFTTACVAGVIPATVDPTSAAYSQSLAPTVYLTSD